MNDVAKALSRANSHWRYWAYRRRVGSPVSVLSTARQWVERFVFEMRQGGSA